MSSECAIFGANQNAPRLGPGALVLVVGPSGAGKDTLIDGARAVLASDRRYFFPRRAVTRAADLSEDHHSMTPQDFAQAQGLGDFLLAWSAHGLSYGIPNEAAHHLRNGEVVVCNTSRTVIDFARHRCARVRVVLVTAPRELRATRMAARGRELKISDRLGRTVGDFDADNADFQLENSTTISAAVSKFVDYLRQVAQSILLQP